MHVDKLSDGQQAMLKKYPSYKIDVYPTRRTAAAPQWVYDNTFKNATRAKTTSNGDSLEGAHGGIPFPIAKTGKEAMWNHLLRWGGEAALYEPSTWIVSGLMTVIGAVWVMVYNADLVLRGVSLVLSRFGKVVPVARIAITYPLRPMQPAASTLK